jgi:beta-phosphoglucomutase
MLKVCLFDLDGVIVDTAKYHYLAWKAVANGLDFDFTEEQNEELKGVSRAESLEIILDWAGIKLSSENKEKQMKLKNNLYLDLIDHISPTEILPGAVDFLEELRNMNIKIGLGSASKKATMILEKVHLIDYFDCIIDGNKTTKGKPHPQVFLMGAEYLGACPFQTVVFEDAQKGIEAAKAGGFFSVGLGDPVILKEADWVIPSLAHLNIHLLKTQFEKSFVN